MKPKPVRALVWLAAALIPAAWALAKFRKLMVHETATLSPPSTTESHQGERIDPNAFLTDVDESITPLPARAGDSPEGPAADR